MFRFFLIFFWCSFYISCFRLLHDLINSVDCVPPPPVEFVLLVSGGNVDLLLTFKGLSAHDVT